MWRGGEAGTTARERALIESRNGGLFETSGVVAKETSSSINKDKTARKEGRHGSLYVRPEIDFPVDKAWVLGSLLSKDGVSKKMQDRGMCVSGKL